MGQRTVRIIGIPMDLGQSRRGVDMGPSAVRYAGLQGRLHRLGHDVHDEGNIYVPNPEEEVAEGWNQRLEAVASVCQAVYDVGITCLERGDFAIFLGGDHSISVGSVAAATHQGSTGVIWIDAHADFNTPESSPSGNIHGMPMAVLIGAAAAGWDCRAQSRSCTGCSGRNSQCRSRGKRAVDRQRFTYFYDAGSRRTGSRRCRP